VVKHLEISFGLLIGLVVEVVLDKSLVAFLASLFPLGQKLEGSRVQLLDQTRLAMDVSESLLNVGHSVQVKIHVEGFIKIWEGYLLFGLKVVAELHAS
jgi:hypothetical protein